MKSYIRLLTIAGSDSGGGAGIQADLKTFSALGCYGMSAITALTAQNTVGVQSILDIPESFIGEQIDSIIEDIGVDAVKVGMLSRPEVIEVVADRLEKYSISKIVLDPVMVAKSGHALLKDFAVQKLKDRLMPLAKIATPNLPEAERLLGIKIKTEKEMEYAAKELSRSGARSILIKGGHSLDNSCNDCLYLSITQEIHWLKAERMITPNTHGTGCTLSSAIAAFLGMGHDVLESVSRGKEFLTEALLAGSEFKLGKGHGPVNHLIDYRRRR